MHYASSSRFLLRTARGLILLALAVFVVLACRADEGLVGPVSLQAAAADSVLEPGHPFRIVGVDLAGIKIRIGGIDAKSLHATSTEIDVAIPDSLFAPCLRAGVRYEVELRRGRQRSVFTMAAAPVPYRVDLSPGEHVFATEAVSRGCPIEVADSGLYLAMPFAWERDDPTPLLLDTVKAQVTVSPENRPMNRKTLWVQRALPKRPSRLVERPDPESWKRSFLPAVNYLEQDRWDSMAPVEASCSAFPVIGDSLLLPTARGKAGRFTGLHGASRHPEYWRVVGSSTHLVALFDGPTLKRARQYPAVKERLLEFLNDYEMMVTPFFAKTLPHWQRQSRIPILMTDSSSASARGFAYPAWETGVNCDGAPVKSDFIWLDATALFRGTATREARLLSTAAHETAHLADFSLERIPSQTARRREWTTEGYADVIRHLWAMQDRPDPFTGNLGESPYITTPEGARVYSLCGLAEDQPRPRAVGGAIDYPMACRMVSSLIARAVEEGQPEASVLEHFSSLKSRRTFTQIANELTGQSRTPNQVVGEWLLSWYADEMPGTGEAIQDPMWNLRRFFPPSTLVDARVSSRGGVSMLSLEELDARYLEISVGGPTQISYTRRGGGPLSTDRTDMALLRVR
ncbi:MAG: hypothetical protein ABI679_10415 [Gemmatimonadota bacterium]